MSEERENVKQANEEGSKQASELAQLSEEALNNVSGGAKFSPKVYLMNPDSITVQLTEADLGNVAGGIDGIRGESLDLEHKDA